MSEHIDINSQWKTLTFLSGVYHTFGILCYFHSYPPAELKVGHDSETQGHHYPSPSLTPLIAFLLAQAQNLPELARCGEHFKRYTLHSQLRLLYSCSMTFGMKNNEVCMAPTRLDEELNKTLAGAAIIVSKHARLGVFLRSLLCKLLTHRNHWHSN